MKLEKIAGGCGSGPCPTVFKGEDGRLFIQGYNVSDEIISSASPPKGETLVEVDQELITAIITTLAK